MYSMGNIVIIIYHYADTLKYNHNVCTCFTMSYVYMYVCMCDVHRAL